jgi:PAS domain S-box-containing protein
VPADPTADVLDTRSNDALALVLEATHTGLWTWDIDSDLVRWSPETYRIHGLKAAEFGGTGAAFFALVHPDDRERVRDSVLSAVRAHRLYTEEFRICRPDGAIRWVMNRGRASYDAHGEPLAVLGTITDITERLMSVEPALRGGEESFQAWIGDQRFRALADAAPALLWVTDADHLCTFLSRGWQEFTGLDESQGLGMGWIEPVHPDDRDRTAAVFLDAAARREPFSIDYRLRRADGEYRWTIDAGRPRFGLRGEFLGYAGSVIDVHERKLAEQQLLRQAALIEGISMGTQDLIAAQDDQYRYVYFNEAYRLTFESLWGKPLRIGTSMLEALSEWPDEREKAQGLWARAHAGESFSVTMSFGRPDEAKRTFDLRFNPVLDATGRQIGAAHILRDITALEASEARLRRIIDSMFAFVGMLEPDGTLVEANQAPLAVAGLSRSEVIGLPFWDCPWWNHDPLVRARLVAAFGRAVRGEAVRYDEEIRIANDGRLTIDFMLQPVIEDGRLVCVIPSGVDVTARTRVEAALARREAEFRALADHMSQLAWMADGGGAIYWYNARWFEHTGTTLEEMQGPGWMRVIHPEHVGRVRDGIRRCFATGEPWEDTFPLRGKDGGYRWSLSHALPIRGEDGRVVRWFGTHTDVEDTRQALDALRRTAGLLRAATEAADLGIHEYDVASGAITWDARVRKLWGVPADAPITYETFIEGIHPEDRAEVRRRVAAALDPGGSGRYEANYRVRSRVDGAERWVYATGQVSFDGRTPLRLVGTVQDVTAQKEAESRLRRADRQKDVFLATLAHELRNPLAPIRTAAQVLGHPQLESAQLGWAQGVIQRQTRNMALLLDDLLDVSRITQGKLTLKRQRMPLATAVEAAVETARPLLDRKRHRLSVSLPPETVEIDADPLRLSQILSNLLTNAGKYTDPGGRIDVLATVDGAHVQVQVRDNGIGIAPGMLAQLFETFAQGDGSHARSEGGLGIGLALVKGLVELHGGSIGAHSDGEGRGSTFRIRLPRAPGSPLPATGRDDATTPRSSRRRVLIADDNRDAADALAMLLGIAGNDVRVTYDGGSALALARQFRPDFAVLDIGLPDLDGHEVARELRTCDWAAGLVLVAVTGWGQDEDRRRAMEAGFDHHLTKPVDVDQLDALLRAGAAPSSDGVRDGSSPAP